MWGCRKRYVVAFTLWPFALIGLAGCGLPPAQQGTPAQRAATLVTQGLTAQISSDLSTAQSDYQQAIQLDANNKYAHYDLGTIYDRQGNHAQAIQEYQTTLVIDPHFVNALFNLAVDTAGANPPNAERLYRQVVALQPTWAGAWLNLGFVLQSEGKAAEARIDWAKAVLLDPTIASRIPSPKPAATPSPTTTR
jgi:tetratricopeptide (TPR) repeat protein